MIVNQETLGDVTITLSAKEAEQLRRVTNYQKSQPVPVNELNDALNAALRHMGHVSFDPYLGNK